MNYFQYFIYKLFRSIIYHLSGITDKFHGNCKHTYPNGKSAMIKGEYYDTCNICGQAEMNKNGIEGYEAFETNGIDDVIPFNWSEDVLTGKKKIVIDRYEENTEDAITELNNTGLDEFLEKMKN